MKIIVDTREQKPLSFPGHETIVSKLDEGDYNIEELEPYIVIERKSLPDFYQSITSDHARFKREILRAKSKHKDFYIFIEGTLEEFVSLKWSDRKLNILPATLYKIVDTMRRRYDLKIVECETRELMSDMIVKTIDNNKKIYLEE